MQKKQSAAQTIGSEDSVVDTEGMHRQISALVERRFDDVDAAGHNSGASLSRLAKVQQEQTLSSFKLLAQLYAELSDVLTLSAWTNGNAQRLTHESGSVSSAVEEIAASVREVVVGSESAAGHTEEVKSLVIGSVDRAKSAERAMSDISGSFDKLNSRLQSLDGAIEAIGGFAKDIEAISNQTKLLALNATIEAARAGEAGKGFAVVASEVKSLSEQTSKTTELIGKQLAELDDVMRAMIESMTDGGAKVKEGGEAFNQVAHDISTMSDRIDTAHQEIGSISEALTVQSTTLDSIATSVTEIAGLAKNNSNDSEASIKLLDGMGKAVVNELQVYTDAHIPNQAVWRLRADHMAWKRSLADCLVGLADPKAINKDMLKQPLGRWIADIQVQSGPASGALQSLKLLEEKMLEAGAGIVDMMMAGNVGEAIGSFFGMEEQSKEALDCITKLEQSTS